MATAALTEALLERWGCHSGGEAKRWGRGLDEDLGLQGEWADASPAEVAPSGQHLVFRNLPAAAPSARLHRRTSAGGYLFNSYYRRHSAPPSPVRNGSAQRPVNR